MAYNGVQIENSPNIIVITDSDANQITVTQPITRTIEVTALGPQGQVGPQGPTGSMAESNSGSFSITGSLTVSGSSTFTNIGPAIFSGSVSISGSALYNGKEILTTAISGGFVTTSSFNSFTSSINSFTASYNTGSFTGSFTGVSNLTSLTSSNALITGNVTVLGTALINTLIVNQTQLSTGSNQLGDAANDTQTLYGTVVIPTGSLTVSGSSYLSGSVGIGTSTPSFKLDVNGSTRISGQLTLTNNLLLDASLSGYAYFINGGAGGWARGYRFMGYASSSYGGLWANGTNDLVNYYTIGSAYNVGLTVSHATANVGIGITNPTARLHTIGSGTTSATTALLVQNANTSASLVVLDNGNVGIGTANPGYKLDVNGNSKFAATFSSYAADGLFSTTALPGIFVGTPSPARGTFIGYRDFGGGEYWGRIGVSGSVAWSLGIGNSAGTNFSIGLNNNTGTDYFTIVSGSGNIGIGTTNPSYKLQVNGSVYFNGSTNDFYVDGVSRFGGTNSYSTVINSSGSIGIGITSPAAKLDISGSIRSEIESDGNFITLQATSQRRHFIKRVGQILQFTSDAATTYDVRFDSSNSSVYILSGSVGIGTTTPGVQLDVVGSIRANSTMFSSTVQTNNIQTNGQNLTILGAGGTAGLTMNQTTRQFGIGTTTPSASLHISGSSGSVLLEVDSDSTQNILYVSGSGNVGIGTNSPTTRLHIVQTSAPSTRETLMKFSVSDAGNDAFFIGNGTSIDNTFWPAFAGFGSSTTRSGIQFVGYLPSSADASDSSDRGILNFEALRTSNSTDPLNGTLTAIQNRKLFTFSDLTGPFVSMYPSRNIAIGTAFIPSAAVHISGASTANLLRIDSPASSSILYVSGSGRVGIGTSNPVATFDVINNSNTASSVPIAAFRTSGSTGHISLHNWTAPFEIVRIESSNDIGNGGSLRLYTLNSSTMTEKFRITNDGQTYIGTGGVIPTARLQVRGIGTTSATTTLLLQNSTPSTLLTILDNGQYTYSGPLLTLAASQSAYVISQSISSSNTVGGQVYGVNITPTFWQTTASQTETAFRVAATFTQSSTLATAGTNIIADFGASSVGSQLTVTDVTSGSIYMVNDVSGLPIIEATSDWTVNMYNFPNLVFQKTGSQVNINGTLRVSGSFILPLSQSVSPQTGSAYWSGSLLFVWDGTRYRSSSFA